MQAQLDAILEEKSVINEQSKSWQHLAPDDFSRTVQAGAARLKQLDSDQAETKALLEHRATLAVYTEKSKGAQDASHAAQLAYEQALIALARPSFAPSTPFRPIHHRWLLLRRGRRGRRRARRRRRRWRRSSSGSGPRSRRPRSRARCSPPRARGVRAARAPRPDF